MQQLDGFCAIDGWCVEEGRKKPGYSTLSLVLWLGGEVTYEFTVLEADIYDEAASAHYARVLPLLGAMASFFNGGGDVMEISNIVSKMAELPCSAIAIAGYAPFSTAQSPIDSIHYFKSTDKAEQYIEWEEGSVPLVYSAAEFELDCLANAED